jgi:electron transport complex protein RnfG
MQQAVHKNAKVLMIFAIVCTAIVGLVNLFTQETIAIQQQRQLLRTLHEIMDPRMMDNDMFQDCVLLSSAQLGSIEPHQAYLAKKGNQPVGVAITTTAPDGYNGNIELIVALTMDGKVSGVSALKHQETPGLGDKIERRKSQWIDSFIGKKVANDDDPRWRVKKDGGQFDQFTGATITPRAVVKAVKNTVLFFQHNKSLIFEQSPACNAGNQQ